MSNPAVAFADVLNRAASPRHPSTSFSKAPVFVASEHMRLMRDVINSVEAVTRLEAYRDAQIVGACASYPDFGADRNFRLRGFRLMLRVEDLEVEAGYKGGSEFRYREEILANQNKDHFPVGRAKLVIEVTHDLTAKGDQQMCKALQE